MDKRIAVKKVGRILAVTAFVAVVGQLALPLVAHAKSSKCVAYPVSGSTGSYVIRCSTSRP